MITFGVLESAMTVLFVGFVVMILYGTTYRRRVACPALKHPVLGGRTFFDGFS